MENQKRGSADLSECGRTRLTILVEESVVVRSLWEQFFKKNEWDLVVFENPLDFLSQLGRFTGRREEVEFFFDQDFGCIRGVGLELARAVRDLNERQAISLITNYSASDFKREIRTGQIQNVYKKYPEVLFGEDFETTQFRSNMALFALGCSSAPCALEKALNFYGWNMQFKLEEHCPEFAPKQVVMPEPTSAVPQKCAQPSTTAWTLIWKLFLKSSFNRADSQVSSPDPRFEQVTFDHSFNSHPEIQGGVQK